MLLNRPSDVPSAPIDVPEGEDRRHQLAVIDWATEAIKEGEAFLRSQEGYNEFESTIKAINGQGVGEVRPSSLSSLSVNDFGKIALDLKAAECDIKPFWDYKTSNVRFQQQAQLAQKLATAWWSRRFMGLRMNEVLSYANATGTGYSHHIWNTEIEDQDVMSEDPRDVLPIRPGSLRSIQECFGVMIRRERSVNWIKACYPRSAKYIKPDRDASYAMVAKTSRASTMLSALGLRSDFMNNLFSSLGGKPQAQGLNIPSADVYTVYVKDPSKNETQHTITMGLDPDTNQRTNWSYDVAPGEELYPRKRCIMFCRSAVLYDGPSIYWHGLFPLSKLTIDPWPWLWLGKAPLRDLLPLHAELNKRVRGISQHFDRQDRPGLSADKNSMSRAAMDRIDTARAGIKIRHNPLAGKGVDLLYEPNLDPQVVLWVQYLTDKMKELSGVKDVTQLTNLGQIPTTETVEKILETMSPSIRLRSQVMESYISEFAMIVLSNFFQFYTQPMRISVLGPVQGQTFEDFDYDPGSLIPATLDLWPNRDPLAPETTRAERAKQFQRLFTYEVAPGSLLASAGVTDKLQYQLLTQAGIMDPVTLLEKLGVPNIAPAGMLESMGTTIMERLKWFQQQGMQLNANSAGRKQTNQQEPRIKMSTSG